MFSLLMLRLSANISINNEMDSVFHHLPSGCGKNLTPPIGLLSNLSNLSSLD